MSLFTPISGTIGGSLIGLSAASLLLGAGEILGCSGIVSSIFVKPRETFTETKAKWKIFFVSAFLITSRVIVTKFGNSREILEKEQQIVAGTSTLPIVSTVGFCVAGFLVGFGTRLGNGCTTGHGICGMARLSKRSFAAVGTFMTTGILSATMCSPMCKPAQYLRTDIQELNNFYPTERSSFYSALLVALFSGIAIPLMKGSRKKVSNQNEKDKLDNDERKTLIAIPAAIIFSAGLFISGMTKNYKIYGFLDMKLLKKGTWDPTLIFVMGSGLLISAIGYHFVKGHNILKNNNTLSCPLLHNRSCGKFNIPTNRKIDIQLIVGNALFGLGWGIAGLCPGPALFLAANGYPQVLFYWWPCNIIGAMLGEFLKTQV